MNKKIKLGALAIEGTVLPLPKNPWGYEGEFAPHSGDIHQYDGGAIEIVDSTEEESLISWIPVERDGKRLLISDRNLLNYISYDQLHEQGLIFGKEVTLDGKRFKLRVLSGGDRPFQDDCELGGYPQSNEWDSYIANVEGLEYLPKPTDADLDEYVSEESFAGEHNQYWNWSYIFSWCQEAHHMFGSSRAVRGSGSARYWYYSTSTYRSTYIGWRPVLEALDSDDLKPGLDIKKELGTLSDAELKEIINEAEEELRTRAIRLKHRLKRSWKI